MKKKLLSTIITIFMINSILVGCGNSIVKKSIEQAKTLIENKEYDKAILSLEMALDEDNKNEEANNLYRIVDVYQKAKKLVDDNKIDEAKEVLDEIDVEYINYAVKEDIDSLKQQVEDKLKEIELINGKLTQLSSLVDEKKYDEANILFEEINKNSLNEEQKNKVNELKSRIDSELAEIEAQKKAEEEARLAEEARKEEEARKAEAESQKAITTSKAIELVRNYLINNGKYVPNIIEIVSENETIYTIRAYDDMGTHTATSGWYEVNKSTGSIWSMF